MRVQVEEFTKQGAERFYIRVQEKDMQEWNHSLCTRVRPDFSSKYDDFYTSAEGPSTVHSESRQSSDDGVNRSRLVERCEQEIGPTW